MSCADENLTITTLYALGLERTEFDIFLLSVALPSSLAVLSLLLAKPILKKHKTFDPEICL